MYVSQGRDRCASFLLKRVRGQRLGFGLRMQRDIIIKRTATQYVGTEPTHFSN